MSDIQEKLQTGISKKIELLNNLTNYKFNSPKEITISDIDNYSNDNFNNDFNSFGENIIYQIFSKSLPFSYEDINKIFQELKDEFEGDKYCISRINNIEHWNNNKNPYCLYIGSKRKDAKNRFIQHLGLKDNRSTYSLFLKDWWKENTELKFVIYELGNIDSESLQIIEDVLWDEYQPLFGKKGSNNK